MATQRDIGNAAADEAFKDDLKNVFQVLSVNLTLAPGAAEKQQVIAHAQRGIASLQLAYLESKKLAQTLP